MKKDILLSIRGWQLFDEEEMSSELAVVDTPGEYYKKNQKHFVFYKEMGEGEEKAAQSILKFTKHSVDITKKGSLKMHMLFERDKKNTGYVHTQFGTIYLGITTKQIQVIETEESIDISINYDLETDNRFLANFDISMNIKANDLI